MKNNVNLIAYANRLGDGGIAGLTQLLKTQMRDLFSGVHVLPFFHPIDGSDTGFDPIDHAKVDARLGSWDDVGRLGSDLEIMADLIVNHISSKSPEFQSVQKEGQASPFWDLFLKFSDIFPDGASETALTKIYRPRPGMPFTDYMVNGEKRLFWTTFTPEQIDINVKTQNGVSYLESILDQFQKNKVKIIRLDAVGYAVKDKNSSCFMTAGTFDFIDSLTHKIRSRGMETLLEIHSHHQMQIEIAKHVDYVYDFALPTLILHGIFQSDPLPLKRWLDISPRNCITVLDTHDGIGQVDVGPYQDLPGLITREDISKVVETIHNNTNGQSRKSTGTAARNLDIYQVNSTYYDALGQNDKHYLIARAIQFFSPGIPQVYYVGLLAGENDMEQLAQSQDGRSINRAFYSTEEVRKRMGRPVVKRLCKLIKFRNENSAFQGDFHIDGLHEKQLTLSWKKGDDISKLKVNFETKEFEISFGYKDDLQQLEL